MIMTKKDYIDYWKLSAEKSWNVSSHLFEKADYVECLFFAHLTLEKILKAYWVKDNQSDFPPRIHNLRRIAEQCNLMLDTDQVIFLEKMNTFQMDGPYPDYRFTIYKAFDQQKTKEVLDKAEILYQWLLKKMP